MSENRVIDELADLFGNSGWEVHREPESGRFGSDFYLSKRGHQYAAEVKISSEGRPDRVIALLSQALIQAQSYSRENPRRQPLAVVWVSRISPALIKKVDSFFHQFAPNNAYGLASADGGRHFVGHGLDALNANPSSVPKSLQGRPKLAYHLFSDLNQWMLKVLLAPEVPEQLLNAPRNQYRNVSELAEAANVSVMSAFRFASRLREEGFLDESGQWLRLVRRADLFQRWQSAAVLSSPEMRMGFLLPGDIKAQIRKLMSKHEICLGLFAAADQLGLGHVSGVPPYVYVPRLPHLGQQAWKGLVPVAPGEQPQLIVKQALAPQSMFRGAVMKDGIQVADVIQVWLDVSSHPSRGAEQAESIRAKVLHSIIGQAA